MKTLIIAVILLAMSILIAGCANTPVSTAPATPAQDAQTMANLRTQQYQSCLVYNASAQLINQKLQTLPLAQANTLYAATKQATELCSTVFTNTTQAAAQLTQALTTISMLAAIQNLH